MTNYNDGKWHGWNGGECPVHPQSMLTVKWSCNGVEATAQAKSFTLWAGKEICAFRVVKECREPREWWLIGTMAFESAQDAKIYYPSGEPVHVREVQP